DYRSESWSTLFERVYVTSRALLYQINLISSYISTGYTF
ncbi:MAG: hypothetical protein ACI843_002769, partial [Psychrobacter glaciei]